MTASSNKISLYLKKTGSPSDLTVYILADNGGVPSKSVVGSTTLSANGVSASYGWVDASFSTPPGLVGGLTYWLAVDAGSSSTKYWTIGSQPTTAMATASACNSADWGASTPVWTDAGRDYDSRSGPAA